MRTYRDEFSNPYPEKGYLEPKNQGSTYLEWLYAQRRSAASDLARLRQLWVEDIHVRAQLLQLAKEFRFHGASVLRLAQVPGCQEALHSAVQGIITKGLV
jgi:hypothetical protein